MLQTAWGALYISLQLKEGDRLLVRGGTTSVGLAAAAIAKNRGHHVMSTTRRADRADLLRSAGVDEVSSKVFHYLLYDYPDFLLSCIDHGLLHLVKAAN